MLQVEGASEKSGKPESVPGCRGHILVKAELILPSQDFHQPVAENISEKSQHWVDDITLLTE